MKQTNESYRQSHTKKTIKYTFRLSILIRQVPVFRKQRVTIRYRCKPIQNGSHQTCINIMPSSTKPNHDWIHLLTNQIYRQIHRSLVREFFLDNFKIAVQILGEQWNSRQLWIRTRIFPQKNCTRILANVIKIYPGPFVARLIITRRTVVQQFVAKMASNVDDREEE